MILNVTIVAPVESKNIKGKITKRIVQLKQREEKRKIFYRIRFLQTYIPLSKPINLQFHKITQLKIKSKNRYNRYSASPIPPFTVKSFIFRQKSAQSILQESFLCDIRSFLELGARSVPLQEVIDLAAARRASVSMLVAIVSIVVAVWKAPLAPGALYGSVHARTSAIFPGARYGRGEFVCARAICLHQPSESNGVPRIRASDSPACVWIDAWRIALQQPRKIRARSSEPCVVSSVQHANCVYSVRNEEETQKKKEREIQRAGGQYT